MVILLHLLQQVTFDPVLKRIGTLLQIIFVVVVITRYQSIFSKEEIQTQTTCLVRTSFTISPTQNL